MSVVYNLSSLLLTGFVLLSVFGSALKGAFLVLRVTLIATYMIIC